MKNKKPRHDWGFCKDLTDGYAEMSSGILLTDLLPTAAALSEFVGVAPFDHRTFLLVRHDRVSTNDDSRSITPRSPVMKAVMPAVPVSMRACKSAIV
jgi:hypothetical protein